MVELLLDRDAPVDEIYEWGGCSETALHYACEIGDLEMVKLLVEWGADIECAGVHESALACATQELTLDVAEFLLSKGANANSIRCDLPPLHIAARVGNTEIAGLLLDAGADPAAAWNISRVQALHVAAQNGHRDMVQLLLDHGAPIDEEFGSGAFSENSLHSACASGNLDVVKLLLQRGADFGYEGHCGGLLGFAVHHGQVDVAKFLLAYGADPNVTVPLFYMPLHLATMNKDLGMMTLLLDNGADVDACCGCDAASENPLHSACYRGNLEMVKLLVARGASLEREGDRGTALGFAVLASKVEVVKLLLDAGANVAVQVPLFVLLRGPGPQPPHVVDLLYLAMGPWHPGSFLESLENYQKSGWELPTGFQRKWKPQPLGAKKKELMAILLAYGANKDATMALVSRHLTALAKEAEHSEDEYLATVRGVLKEAEEAIPEVLEMYK
ncbi:ankyrin repeat-containing domain protein [Mycena crocata]|nr:ankyrin repeat-containing domain protein [Mycena crocata]